MKKSSTALLILLFCGLFVSTTVVQAQSPVNFGVKVGANFANFNNTDANFDSRTGFQVGGFINFNLPILPFSIQPEVLYSQKGAEQPIPGGTATVEVDYLEVPVLAKLGLPIPGPLTPHLLAGPYAGFVLNSELTDGSSSVEIDNTQTDFGGIVGLGTDLNIGLNLTIDGRYGFAFTDTFDGGQGKNGVWTITAGIGF